VKHRLGKVVFGDNEDLEDRGLLRAVAFWIIISVLVGLCSALLLTMLSEAGADSAASLLGLEKKSDVLARLALALGGALVALQAWASYGRAKSLEQTVRSQHRANENSERGQRQERLRSGIDHLGNESESVRLGGAYELFHLAREFRRFRQTVVDILCAHIRQTTGKGAYQDSFWEKPSNEVQSLLTLLFVNDSGVFEGCRVDLSGSWLRGAELREAKLEWADLEKIDLGESVLSRAKMAGAMLFGANLQGAYVVRADLREAALLDAKLEGANLGRTLMQGATLDGARLQATNLAYVQLQGSLLADTAVQGSHFFETDMRGASPEEFVESEPGRLLRLVDTESELTSVAFSGGLTASAVEALVSGMSKRTAAEVRDRLKEHVGVPVSRDVPEGVRLGSYTFDEAMEWLP